MDNLYAVMPLLNFDAAGIIIFYILYFSFRKRSGDVKKNVLYILCLINIIVYLLNEYFYCIEGNSILTLLPLQLCDMGVFLIPFAIAFKKKSVLDFVFFVSVPGAISALLVPSGDFSGNPFAMTTVSFFLFHFMIVTIPLLTASFGMYSPSPGIKKALKLSAVLFVVSGIMHLVNLFLGAEFHVEADYCFTIIKYSAPGNPVFQLFSEIIPYDFFYLIPALSILYGYMLIVFAVITLKGKFAGKKNKSVANGM